MKMLTHSEEQSEYYVAFCYKFLHCWMPATIPMSIIAYLQTIEYIYDLCCDSTA